MGFVKAFRKKMRQKLIQRNQSKGRTGVYIGIPSVSGEVPAQIVKMISQAFNYNADPACPYFFRWGIMRSVRPIEFARNLMVRDFLRSECQILYFVDADTLPSDNWGDLLNVDADIVAGAYLQFDENLETGITLKLLAFQRSPIAGWDTVLPGDDIREIDAAGTGVMTIRRRVFEDARMLLPTKYTDYMGNARDLDDEKDNHDWAPPYFPPLYKPNGQLMMTEDLPFCQRAKDLGYTVKFHPGVMFGHLKRVNLVDVARLVVGRAKEAVERGTVEPKPYEEQLAESRRRKAERGIPGMLPAPAPARVEEEDEDDSQECAEEEAHGGQAT